MGSTQTDTETIKTLKSENETQKKLIEELQAKIRMQDEEITRIRLLLERKDKISEPRHPKSEKLVPLKTKRPPLAPIN